MLASASLSPLVVRNPNGARWRRKARTEEFQKNQSTGRRSAPVPADHAAAPYVRPAVAAARPAAACVQAVATPAALTSSRSAAPGRGESRRRGDRLYRRGGWSRHCDSGPSGRRGGMIGRDRGGPPPCRLFFFKILLSGRAVTT